MINSPALDAILIGVSFILFFFALAAAVFLFFLWRVRVWLERSDRDEVPR